MEKKMKKMVRHALHSLSFPSEKSKSARETSPEECFFVTGMFQQRKATKSTRTSFLSAINDFFITIVGIIEELAKRLRS